MPLIPRLGRSTIRFIPAAALALLIAAACGLPPRAVADLPVSPQVLNPATPAEAWNVIRLATANVARLIAEERLQEVADQIVLCSPALHTLARFAPPAHKGRVDQYTALAFRRVNDTAQNARNNFQPSTETAFARLEAALEELKKAFELLDVDTEIYVCPLHPKMLSTEHDTACRYCEGRLRVRRIPYTELYVKPNPDASHSQLLLVSEPEPSLEVNTPATLRVALQSAGGKPLSISHLLPLHSAPVRFLLIDQTLTDLQVLTPAALDPPGTFESSFTPAKPGPYRLWAEIAPEDTALVEFPALDLGGEFEVVDRSRHDFIDALVATAGGLTFRLSFTGGNGGFPPPRQLSLIRIHVSDAAGQPVTHLEPFMNAFAHLTGVFEDGRTLLRLHPEGGDILRDDVRGGPQLSFKVYPPRSGFVRLFCQVKVDGKIVTVPLGVHIRE